MQGQPILDGPYNMGNGRLIIEGRNAYDNVGFS
jgi:hypothetical protein